MDWLESAYAQHDSGLLDLKYDPIFDSVRRDPRYAKWLERMQISQ